MRAKKYELLDQTITVGDHTLYRIKALTDFNDVKAGDIGGYIEKEENLSQSNLCWVYDNAIVYGNSKIRDNAEVRENAIINDMAEVYDNAMVRGNSVVRDSAIICGNGIACDDSIIFGSAVICGGVARGCVKIGGGTVIRTGYHG